MLDITANEVSTVTDLDTLKIGLEIVYETILDNGLLVLPEDLEIILTPNDVLKDLEEHQKASIGSFDPVDMSITMHCGGFDLGAVLKIFVHELIHCEQHMLGWLEWDFEQDAMLWFGEPVQKLDEELTYQQYLDLPWERDAHRRENEIYERVIQLLDEELEE